MTKYMIFRFDATQIFSKNPEKKPFEKFVFREPNAAIRYYFYKVLPQINNIALRNIFLSLLSFFYLKYLARVRQRKIELFGSVFPQTSSCRTNCFQTEIQLAKMGKKRFFRR